jgi:hypothetical protein
MPVNTQPAGAEAITSAYDEFAHDVLLEVKDAPVAPVGDVYSRLPHV